jgi:hypothetical protein
MTSSSTPMILVHHANEAMERATCEYHGQGRGCAALFRLGESKNTDGGACAIQLGVPPISTLQISL